MSTYNRNYLDREAWVKQVQENSARLAWAWGTATTTGAGQKPFEKIINFGLAFTEKPHFSYGYELLNRTDFEDDDGGNDLPVPRSTGCVYMWRVDGRGLYTGAHVAVNIVSDKAIQIEHHFSFAGIAIKDLIVNNEE